MRCHEKLCDTFHQNYIEIQTSNVLQIATTTSGDSSCHFTLANHKKPATTLG